MFLAAFAFAQKGKVGIRPAGIGTTVRYSADNLSTFTPSVSLRPLMLYDWAFDGRRGSWYYWNGLSWQARGLNNGMDADLTWTKTNVDTLDGWDASLYNRALLNKTTASSDTVYIDLPTNVGSQIPHETFCVEINNNRTSDADTMIIQFDSLFRTYDGNLFEWRCPPRARIVLTFRQATSVEGNTWLNTDDILGSYGHTSGGGGSDTTNIFNTYDSLGIADGGVKMAASSAQTLSIGNFSNTSSPNFNNGDYGLYIKPTTTTSGKGLGLGHRNAYIDIWKGSTYNEIYMKARKQTGSSIYSEFYIGPNFSNSFVYDSLDTSYKLGAGFYLGRLSNYMSNAYYSSQYDASNNLKTEGDIGSWSGEISEKSVSFLSARWPDYPGQTITQANSRMLALAIGSTSNTTPSGVGIDSAIVFTERLADNSVVTHIKIQSDGTGTNDAVSFYGEKLKFKNEDPVPSPGDTIVYGMVNVAGVKSPINLPYSGGGGGGSGTVTSVGLSLPSIFSVSGSPVITSGTLTGTLATQTANTIFAGPTSGGAATPTFRALVAADLPSGAINTTSNGIGLNGSDIRLGNSYMASAPSIFTATRNLNLSTFRLNMGTNSDSTLLVADGSGNKIGIGMVPSAAKVDITGNPQTGSSGNGVLNMVQTWNTSGNPTGIKLNVTNTASGSTSNLMDLQLNGSSKFLISKDGDFTVASINSSLITSNTSATPLVLNTGSATISLELKSLSTRRLRVLGTSSVITFESNNNTNGFAFMPGTFGSGNVGIGTTSPDRLFHVESSNSTTNTVTQVTRFSQISSGTVTNGFGLGIELAELENASGNNVVAAIQNIIWTNATNANESAHLLLTLVKNGTMDSVELVKSTGQFQWTEYGGGAFTGTPTYFSAWDVNGNFIERTAAQVASDISAFVQGGNSFGTTATLGTNDNFRLSFEVNNTQVQGFQTDGRAEFFSTPSAATSTALSIYQAKTSSATDDDEADINIDLKDSAGNQTTYVSLKNIASNVTNGSEQGKFTVNVLQGGSPLDVFSADGDAIRVFSPFIPVNLSATDASALTPVNGMFIYVTSTNGTFTTVGFWGYENGAWVDK